MLRLVRCFVLFFQAEDGIRDLVRSRGLGDVYKRQGLQVAIRVAHELVVGDADDGAGGALFGLANGGEAVSYTHLTLPTSDLV